MSSNYRFGRVGPEFENWGSVLDLIVTAFAPMNGVIDPPSSALTLTTAILAAKSREETAFLAYCSEQLAGCVFCKTEKQESLYIGKLAVSPDQQGRGLGRALLQQAEDLARETGCTALRLETRIELVGNHRFFQACGFQITAYKSHPGFSRVTFVEMQKRI